MKWALGMAVFKGVLASVKGSLGILGYLVLRKTSLPSSSSLELHRKPKGLLHNARLPAETLLQNPAETLLQNARLPAETNSIRLGAELNFSYPRLLDFRVCF